QTRLNLLRRNHHFGRKKRALPDFTRHLPHGCPNHQHCLYATTVLMDAVSAARPSAPFNSAMTKEQYAQLFQRFQELKRSPNHAHQQEALQLAAMFKQMQQSQMLKQHTAGNMPQHLLQNPQNGNIGAQFNQPQQQPVQMRLNQGQQPAQMPSLSSSFTTEQLNMLRTQISAFKYISKNMPLPQSMQQALAVGSSSMPKSPFLESKSTVIERTLDDIKEGHQSSAEAEEFSTKPVHYELLASPFHDIKRPIGYLEHSIRQNRVIVPCIMPEGLNPANALEEREKALNNRIVYRISELERLPGNIQEYDYEGNGEEENNLKVKALIELKSLRLLKRQRALRQDMVRSMSQFHSLITSAHRAAFRRMKKATIEDARLTEDLERRQRMEREHREKQKEIDRLNRICEHGTQMIARCKGVQAKQQKIGRAVLSYHSYIEKEEQRRMERTAKQRLQALKADDEEAYMKLLDQTKDTRITHLLGQTNHYLDSLAQAVRAQQKEMETVAPIPKKKEKEGDQEADAGEDESLDYYNVAHKIQEQLEFEKWAPAVRKVVYKGPPLARRSIQQQHMRKNDFQVLLTTYEYIIKDRPVLSKIKWIHMIIDEGHRMKNTQSKLTSTLCTYYSTRYRLILTGTPLQNNLPELWALLNFVLPKIFNSVKSFDEWFNAPFANTGGQDKMELSEEEALLVIRRLHKVLRPFLLRRLKKDVESELPDKVEKIIKCKFSALQSRLYGHLKNSKMLLVEGGHGKSGIKGLKNTIMQLRKVCNHPFVFEEVEQTVNPEKQNNDKLWRVSGKFELLDRILPKFKVTGHRILMFFQMTQIMHIMEDFLLYRGYTYLRLDGSTKADDRSEMLKVFNAPNSPYFIFLLSTRAGGLGLNLQTADTVIIFDSDWNPHQDLQAQDRAHRIGQTKEVRILRLITTKSVEEHILARAQFKLDLDGKVIQAGKFDNKSTAEEREEFLRSLLEQENDVEENEDEEYDEEDLNEILSRNENELNIFRQMDIQRERESPYGKGKALDRIFMDHEVPALYRNEEHIQFDEIEFAAGRGARERAQVKYDDGLTEEQWLDAIDNEDLEGAVAEKHKKLQKRADNKIARKHNGMSPSATIDSPESPDASEISGRKKRDRSSRGGSIDNTESTRKRARTGDSARRGRQPAIDPKLKAAMISLCENCIQVLESSIDPGDGHNRSDLFKKLPSKTHYADYYDFIREPIAMDKIKKRAKSGFYKDVQLFRQDFDLMFNNARTYNEEGSFVYNDANALEALLKQKLDELAPGGFVAPVALSANASESASPESSARFPKSKLSYQEEYAAEESESD
ncbi:Chromatin structure-remodeling complex subunit snf21, partial [Neolecta irregularis DAH-3]